MTRSASPKLVTYLSLACGSVAAGLLLGRLELFALVIPLVTALAAGLALASSPEVESELRVDADRCLEGEEVVAEIQIAGTRTAEVEVALTVPAGLTTTGSGPSRTVVLAGDAPLPIRVPLRAARWGAHTVGPVITRSHSPGRLVTYERVSTSSRPLRVYPPVALVRRPLAPAQTQVFTGNYVSSASGDGLEFSGVREFVAGDLPRRVNWRVTSRRGGLHVNEFHPERNADVILFIDTFADVGPPGRTSLDLAVRGAATLARHYLVQKDRVGLVAFGGLLGWLRAASGQAQLHRIFDYLIGVQATTSYAHKTIEYLPPRSLPQLALVIAFSPLVDQRAVGSFIDLHARGFGLVVIDTLGEDSVGPGPTREDHLAHRTWRLLRRAERFDLQQLGIPVISWTGEAGVESVTARLGALRRMPRVRRA